MKKTPGVPGKGTNNFDRDILVQSFVKNKQIAKELPELKDITTYQGFIAKLEEKITDFDLEKATAMAQLLIWEIDNDIKYGKNERLMKLMQKNDIKEMDENFLKLPQEQRILITKYRHENNTGENYSKDKKFGCGSYGYFKVDTTCGSCISGGQNLAKAGLRNLAKFLGDRQNAIPDEIIEKAVLSLFTDEDKQEIDNLKIGLHGYIHNIKKLIQQEKTRKDMIMFFDTYEKFGGYKEMKKIMPDFVEYAQNNASRNANIKGLDVDKENKVVCIAKDRSQINGTGPMTYWIELSVWHDNQTKTFKLFYIDPSIPNYQRYEDYSRHGITFDIEKQGEDKQSETFIVTMYNKDKSKHRDYTAKFEKKESKRPEISKEEQEKFKETFDKTIQEICTSETREDGIMFERIGSIKVEKFWEKSEFTDKYLDVKTGIGACIIKTQIDSGANASAHNKQYARRGYIITVDGKVNEVRYQCAREEQLGLIDFSISDPKKIDKEKVKAITETTAQVLLEKHG